METSFSSSSFGGKEPQRKDEDSFFNDSYPKPRDIGYQQFLSRYQNAVGTKTPETTTSKNGNDDHEDLHRPTLSYGFSSTSTETDAELSKQQRRVRWIRCLLQLLILSAIACLIAFEFGALSKRKQVSNGAKGLNSTQSTSPSTSSSALPSTISTNPRRNNDVHPNAPNANAIEGGTAIVTTDDSNDDFDDEQININDDYDEAFYDPNSWCGLTRRRAERRCEQPCPSGTDDQCGSGHRCFGGINTCVLQALAD